MVESVEIRKVKNGYIVAISTDEGTEEMIFSKMVHVIKYLKTALGD